MTEQLMSLRAVAAVPSGQLVTIQLMYGSESVVRPTARDLLPLFRKVWLVSEDDEIEVLKDNLGEAA